MPAATSNRPPVGHKRHPYGWSARQAAQLAGIPARTVQQWAVDGLVAPTYTNPTLRNVDLLGSGRVLWEGNPSV